MSNYMKRIVGGSFFIFFIAILSSIISFFIRILLANNLTLEEYGLFYAVFVFVSFFALFRNFGLGAALIKHVPEFKVKEKFDTIKSTIFITSSLRICISVVFGILFYVLSDFLATYYFHNETASLILKFLAVFFILSVFIDITKNLFEAFQKPFWFPLVDFSKNIFLLTFILLFFYFGIGLFAPVLSHVLISFVIPLIFLPIVLSLFKFSKYKFVLSKELTKKLFLFGLPFVLISMAGIFIAQIDTLLLTYFRTLEEVGIYNVVLPFSLILLQFSSAISVILFPMVSEFWAKGQRDKLVSAVNALYKYSFAFIVPLGFLVFSFTPSLLNLFFGEEYVVGTLAMRILLIGVIMYTVANVNQYVLAGIGKPKVTAKIVTVVALFNFFGNLLLIPIYGIVGAALMTTLSYFLSLILSLVYLRKFIHLKVSISSWFKIFLSGVIIVFIVYLLKKLFTFNIWIELIFFSVVALFIYLICLFVFRVVNLLEIKRLFHKIIG